MSTEVHDAAEAAKKKLKRHRNKDSMDKDSKKRKREEHKTKQASVEQQIEHRPSKKQKKDQKSVVQAVESNNALLEQHSPFVKQTTSFYLPLSPCAHDFALEGLCAEHISPLLLTYFPPLKGILLSYENARMSENADGAVQSNGNTDGEAILSRSIDEYAVTYVWLTADFTIFKPRRGTYLEGQVNIQNESMLGLVCYNYFNAVIARDKLPEDWKWVDDEDETGGEQARKRRGVHPAGHFETGAGEEVEGTITFKVEDFDATPSSDGSPGTVSIIGTLRLSREET